MQKSRILNIILKLGLAIILAFVLYKQLSNLEDVDYLKEELFSRIKQGSIIWMIAFVCFMPLNWILESIKWRELFGEISFKDAFKTILAGISLAIVTPNRIGEYGGRLLVIPAGKNWNSIIATLVGSISQNIVTIIFGTIGIIFLSSRIDEFQGINLFALLATAIVFIGLGLYLYFNISILGGFVKAIGLKKHLFKFHPHFLELSSIARTKLLYVLCISACRYILYASQYYFVLRFLGLEVDFVSALQGISTVLFIQSSIPLPPFMSILARGEISLFVWGLFDLNELIILSMTFLIWSINLLLPAILGYVVILRTNIAKTLGYENK